MFCFLEEHTTVSRLISKEFRFAFISTFINFEVDYCSSHTTKTLIVDIDYWHGVFYLYISPINCLSSFDNS
jgi:hypothetical protein